MYFLDKRIQVICSELKRLTTVQKLDLKDIVYKEGRYFTPLEVDESKEVFKVFDQASMKWYGKDRHYWFRSKYTIPEELKDKTLFLHIRTQIEEWDDAKNPQFLIFINGEVRQGMDMNHRELLLCENAVPGETYKIDVQAYTGILHSDFDMMMQIWQIDRRIERLYYDLVVPLGAFSRMEKDEDARLKLETALNDTINLIDFRNPYSDTFYESIEKAEAYITKAVYEDMAGYNEVIASCIGHTHIDVAWWWTVEQTREKVARSFATVLELMEEYPDYRFMSSQPQLYVFLKERYPKLYEKVKERIKEGRWEAEGGMWLEADTNLTSGESLVRQFLYGKHFFKEEFGVDNKVLWLPDVFGYSGALPQIMKKSGIEYFMTTKLAWNQIDEMPYDTFNWKGIDGSSILTHLVTTLGVGQSTNDFFTTYNGMLHPDAIMGGWKRYQNKDINNDILVCFGYGDGGGGPTRDMLETSKRMEKGIKGIPKVRQVFSRTYFDELSDRVKDNKRLPTWEGELYFEYHRGTYTSMARNKRSNRKSEIMLMNLEFLSVLAGDPSIVNEPLAYPHKALSRLWKVVLLNQFHDILPGSSIHEVYEVTKKEYAEVKEVGEKLIGERLKALCSRNDAKEESQCGSECSIIESGLEHGDRKASGALTVFNTLSFERSDIISIPGEMVGTALEHPCLLDGAGKRYPLQKDGEDYLVYAEAIPSKGYASFLVSDGTSDGDGRDDFICEGNTLDTPYYKVVLSDDGSLSSLYDKQNAREIIETGKKANLFVMYEDKPMDYDNWDIDMYYTEKSWEIDGLVSSRWITDGPVCMILEQVRRFSLSKLVQKIYFYRDKRRIDFSTYVDWKEHQHLLKVHFPIAVHTDEASFDIQFGNLKRKTHKNTSWDQARFESCGQKWVDVSEGHYGVSLLNDCKYGHSVNGSDIGLTLIKSGILPNPVTDQEEHTFIYSLYPHNGSLYEGHTIEEGYSLNVPLLPVACRPLDGEWAFPSVKEKGSFLSVDKRNIIIETIKEAEDKEGIIIRAYESENTRTKAVFAFGMDKEIVSVAECNLMEEKQDKEQAAQASSGKYSTGNDACHFTTEFLPFEIKSFRVLLK